MTSSNTADTLKSTSSSLANDLTKPTDPTNVSYAAPRSGESMLTRPSALTLSTPSTQPARTHVVKSGEKWSEGAVQNRMRTDQNFMWWRARLLGGRTNHYGRVHLRMGPRDFKPRSTDGLGFDWPISYDDLEPYYTKVEMLIGVFGTNPGMENTPDSPPGVTLRSWFARPGWSG